MTKSFEVSIAIILLLLFVFFLFETTNQRYQNNPIPEEVKTIILFNAQDLGFRELVNNNDVNNLYSLLYPQLDYKFNISVCDWLNTDCQTKDISGFTKRREHIYYFADLNKTLHLELD